MAWLVDPCSSRRYHDLVRARTAEYDDVRAQHAEAQLFTSLWRFESRLVRLLTDYSAHCVTDQPFVEVQVFVR